MQILREQKSVHLHYSGFFTTMASADFFDTLISKFSPGKVLKLIASCRQSLGNSSCIALPPPSMGLYLMCLSVTAGFRVSWHTHRPHPASLLVRVPTVVLLLRASFRLTSWFPPCVSLRLSLLLPVISFQITSFSPCWAHQERL